MSIPAISWDDRLSFIRLGLQSGLSFALAWVGVYAAIQGNDGFQVWPYIAWTGLAYASLYSIGAAMSWKSASILETSDQREARILAALDLPPKEQASAMEQSIHAHQAWEGQWYAPEQSGSISKWTVAGWMGLASLVGSAVVWLPMAQLGFYGLIASVVVWVLVIIWVHRFRQTWRMTDFLLDLSIPILASLACYGFMNWLL